MFLDHVWLCFAVLLIVVLFNIGMKYSVKKKQAKKSMKYQSYR